MVHTRGRGWEISVTFFCKNIFSFQLYHGSGKLFPNIWAMANNGKWEKFFTIISPFVEIGIKLIVYVSTNA